MATLRKTALILLILLGLLGGLCWLAAEQLVNELLRPQLERVAAKALEAEVAIDHLAWAEEGLEARKLEIRRADGLQLSLRKLEAKVTFSGLWQRRLDALHIIAPQIKVIPSPDKPASTEPSSALPEHLPLTINRLTITDGELLLKLAERSFQLRNIDFAGALANEFPFSLSAFIGPEDNHPLKLIGSISLAKVAILTLEKLNLEDRSLLSSPLSLSLSGSGLEQAGGTLRIAEFDHQKLREILAAVGESDPLPKDLRFSLTDTDISLRLEEKSLKANLSIAAGKLVKGDLSVPFALQSLELSKEADSWRAEGDLTGPAGLALGFSALHANGRLTGQAKVEVPNPDRLKTELLGGQPLGLAGRLRLAVDYSLGKEQLQLQAGIQGSSAKRPPNYRINLAELSGRLALQHDRKTDSFSLSLQQAEQPLLTAKGDLQRLEFNSAPLSLSQLGRLLAPELLPPQLHKLAGFTATGRLTSGKRNSWRGNFKLAAANAGFARFDLAGISAQGDLQLATDRLETKNLIFKAGASLGEEIAGDIAGQLSGSISSERVTVKLKKLDLAQFNYLSADGLRGLGNGRIELSGTLAGKLPLDRLELKLSGTAAADEFLAGEIYADLSALKGQFSLLGDFIPAGTSLSARSLQIDVPTLGAVNGTGRFSPEQVSFRGMIELADLADAYGRHIAPLLTELRPRAEGLTIEGGLAIETDLRWTPAGWRASGQLRPQGLDAFWDLYDLELVNGRGQLPFFLERGAPLDPARSPAELQGELSFAALSLGLASLDAGSLRLTATPNRLTFRSPLRLQLAGGRVAIDDLSFGWAQDNPQGSVRIAITAVDLATLNAELGLPPMQGTFTADLGLLRYAEQQLSTEGTASLEVFGGRFLLRNMRYSEPFSRYPIFYADIDFSGLDLLQATRTFEFGEMNGIIDGHIHKLRLFGTTPSAFDAEVKTRREGKRNISVKALQNLSIISQGGISAALSRGVYRFIDFYRYQKIGFECSLENDTFKLIGTARSDSKRYLVYGGWLPPRIDITTTTPTISFKEMVGRLSRIERAGN